MITAGSGSTLPAPGRLGLLDTFESAYGANLIGCTVMRIRGRIWQPVLPAATLQYRVGIKVSDNRTPPDAAENLFDAREIGGAHDDWMGWYVLAGGPASAGISDNMTMVDVDVRSRRKVDELGQRLELYTSGFTGLAAAEGVLALDLSVLVALP